jgi:hypothetical protein
MYSNILIAADPDDPRSRSSALPGAASLARCLPARLALCAAVRDVDAARQAQWSPIAYREMIRSDEAGISSTAAPAAAG